jgi:hypothetical protein
MCAPPVYPRRPGLHGRPRFVHRNVEASAGPCAATSAGLIYFANTRGRRSYERSTRRLFMIFWWLLVIGSLVAGYLWISHIWPNRFDLYDRPLRGTAP